MDRADSPTSGDGMGPPLDDLTAAGEGFRLVPILRGEALDDKSEPTRIELPAPALMGAKP